MSIQRWGFGDPDKDQSCADLYPQKDGDWVKFADHLAGVQALEQERDSSQTQLATPTKFEELMKDEEFRRICAAESAKGDIEQLRAQLAETKAGWGSSIADLRKAAEICRGVEAERDALRAQLARVNGLIAQVHNDFAAFLDAQEKPHE